MRFPRVFAVLLLLAGISFAQQPPVPGTPEAKTATEPKSAAVAKPADYSQEPFVVELQRTIYRFENDGTGKRIVSTQIRVLSEAGVQQLGQLLVGYNSGNENVEIGYVRARKADGSVVNASSADVQDMTAPVAREAPVYTDYRQKHITVRGLRPGETLEYQFIITTEKALAPGQFWMEHEFFRGGIILADELEVNIPKKRAVKVKTRPGFEPKITDEGDRRIYRWSTSHKQREDEPDDRASQEKLRRKLRMQAPAVQMTTFSSWQELGHWYAGLEKDRRITTPELRARAEELVKGKTSEMEKVRAIYDYVAKNYRYVSLSFGVGRFQPHTAAEVLGNQYGDCKDKHTLLAGLLEAIGIHASSALINSSRKVDPDVPSPSQFDHVISVVPVGGETVWLDTTTEIAPFRMLTFNLRKKLALVIPPDGNARLMETPADAALPNTQVTEIDGKVSELGKLTAHVRITATGDTELPLRSTFRQVPNVRWKDLADAIARIEGFRVTSTSNVKADDPADNSGPYHIEFDIVQPNYLDWSKPKSQVDLPVARMNLPDISDRDESPGPVEIGAPGVLTMRLKLELPPNFTARGPLPFSMTRDYADYRASYEVKGQTFTAERRLQLQWRELPVARLSDYNAFRRAIAADDLQQLAMESAEQGAPKPPANMKADELYEAGLTALQSQNYRAAIELLKRVTELEPKHKSAWNDLGNAYLGVRQVDDAIKSINKQIELNPYDEFAYNNLGRAYWEQRQYDKAAAAFKKQIDVNPLDKFAHRNLGIMYLEEHKNQEALAELEKAVSLQSQDPFLLTSLGQAQLELGKTDDAIRSFDRAVSISPTPVVWNNVAYQLSLKDTHLDRAQQYAESAVAATAATLRNLSADRQQLEQQAMVVSLAAQWDTLGWVHFQRGNLEQAEQFIKAAWMLGQHAEVGDHLAQVYEKRGQKEKAIDQYAQALAAYKPLPETRPRLAALVGDKKVDALVERARLELAQQRTVKLGQLVNESAQAEFYVVLGPGSKVQDVLFIRGSDKLKQMGEVLRAANFSMPFPDSTPTRLLRRGTLSCDVGTECKFVLVPADDFAAAQ